MYYYVLDVFSTSFTLFLL